MPIIYDHNFNYNELFVLLVLIMGFIIVWKLPKRFSSHEFLVYLLYSVFLGILMDHTISIEPFDFYDVNDSSAYQLMDFLTYVMYGPYGYLFIYLFDYFRIPFKYTTLYAFFWTLTATAFEYAANQLGVFHYKNGYQIWYSIILYLIIYTAAIGLYRILNSKFQSK